MIRKNLFKASLVSILLMCVSYTWAYDFEEGNFYYTVISLEDMTVEVSGLVDSDVSDVVIPKTTEYKNRTLTVTTIGESLFANNKTLQSVSLPNTITDICSSAFSGCTSLPGITLPESLQTIGKSTFYNCVSISSLTLPSSLESLGSSAFQGCSGLTSITLPNGIKSIPSSCLRECTSLVEISLPVTLESIGSYAFYNCSSLKVLDIPDNVTSLDTYALHGCTGLESLYVGAGIPYLRDYTTSTRKNNPSYYPDTYYEYFPLFWDDGPSEMKNIVLKDGSDSFGMRGYSYSWSTYKSSFGDPIFSNIPIEYYYIGRPLTDIKSWGDYEIGSIRKQPCGKIQTLEIGGYCTEVPFFYQSVEYLILGEDVNTYTISNIYQDNMKGIICRSMTPPTLDTTFEISTYVNVVLYVPTGSKSAYQSAAGWSDFWDIVELDTMPPGYTAIEDIATNAQTEVREIYTINGQRLNSPQRGINIIRYSDGTTKKIMIK